MTRYQVDSEQVQMATQSAHATIERVRSEVASLMAQLTGLQGSWSGQAATAFQAAVTDWRATQQHVEESLAGLGHALGAAAMHYADVEQTNARLFVR